MNQAMTKRKLTLTIEPRIINKLKTISKQNNRSMSNMVETLINEKYEQKQENIK